MTPLLDDSLRCEVGSFAIDPTEPVATAVVTHAHGDHLTAGCGRYLCAAPSVPLVARRLASTLGDDAASASTVDHGFAERLLGVPYGQPIRLGRTTLSFHPAGHILGSAQVRVVDDATGAVWVVSGDYKREPDPTCAPFELLAGDVFVTEATWALPIYRWPGHADEGAGPVVARELLAWWEEGARNRRASVLLCYPLGKAQRLLAELWRLLEESGRSANARPVYVHGTIEPYCQIYREAGIRMLPTVRVADEARRSRERFTGDLILAPRIASGTTWMRRFGDYQLGLVTGGMRVRGVRRRASADRGFVLSDHADWPALLRTVEEVGARRVLTMHGYAEPLARALRERGYEARALATHRAFSPDFAERSSGRL